MTWTGLEFATWGLTWTWGILNQRTWTWRKWTLDLPLWDLTKISVIKVTSTDGRKKLSLMKTYVVCMFDFEASILQTKLTTTLTKKRIQWSAHLRQNSLTDWNNYVWIDLKCVFRPDQWPAKNRECPMVSTPMAQMCHEKIYTVRSTLYSSGLKNYKFSSLTVWKDRTERVEHWLI